MMHSIIACVAKELTGTNRFVMQSGFDTSKGCIHAYLFKERLSHPTYFAKIARFTNTNFLKSEFINLELLKSKLNSDLLKCLPKVNSYKLINKHEVLVFGYFNCNKLSDTYSAIDKKRQILPLKKILQWVCKLNESMRQQISESIFNRLIKDPILTFLSNRTIDDSLKLKAKQSLEMLEKNFSNLFITFEHGDFQENNILFNNKSRFCVVDWESGISEGLPAVDLFHLLMRVGLSKNNSLMSYVEKYSQDINLQIGIIPCLYVAFLIRRHWENSLQRAKTLHFDQTPLLDTLYKVSLNYDFRFVF